jgi:ATP-dependent RNA helicase DDX21
MAVDDSASKKAKRKELKAAAAAEAAASKKEKEKKRRAKEPSPPASDEEESTTSSEEPAPAAKKAKKDKKVVDERASLSSEDGDGDVTASSDEDPADPNALTNFRISEPLRQSLKSKGIKVLFPIQASTFNLVFDGCDLVGRARTGQVSSPFQFCLVSFDRFGELSDW